MCIRDSYHTNRQTTYNLTRAVRGLLRGGDDVRGAVIPSMSWLQATVALVTHVVEFPLRILRTAVVVVLCYSIAAGNTLTSYTLTITLLLTVSTCGLIATRTRTTLRFFVLVFPDIITHLCVIIASISTRVMFSFHDIVRCSNS